MPTTKQCLTPSAANDKIGGIPAIYYFDFQSKGRGQVLRLLWEDAGISYKDVRFSFEEYPDFKQSKLKTEMNPLGTIPVVELNGRMLTQSYAILRKFARMLGAYDGKDDEEMYWVDAMTDAALDWRTCFVNAAFSPNKDTEYPAFEKDVQPNFLYGLDQSLRSHAASTSGPYVLGNTVTYADLVIYQVAHDAQLTKDNYAGLKEYARLRELCKTVEARPNVKAFMESDRYLG